MTSTPEKPESDTASEPTTPDFAPDSTPHPAAAEADADGVNHETVEAVEAAEAASPVAAAGASVAPAAEEGVPYLAEGAAAGGAGAIMAADEALPADEHEDKPVAAKKKRGGKKRNDKKAMKAKPPVLSALQKALKPCFAMLFALNWS